MKKFIVSSAAIVASMALSSMAYAQVVITPGAPVSGGTTNLGVAANVFAYYISLGAQLILAAAVVWVAWSAFQFIMSAGDEEGRGKARDGIIYGIIGIAVIVSIWGLVNFIQGSAGVGQGSQMPAPGVF